MIPIFILPKVEETYTVRCLERVYGGVLMQKRNIIAYTSKQLHLHENNNTTYDLKLEIVVHVLKIWHHYLYVQFEVYIVHKSLTYLFSQKDLNMCQRSLVKFLTYYNFQIIYHLGKANVVADALKSKMHITTIMMSTQALTEQLVDWHP